MKNSANSSLFNNISAALCENLIGDDSTSPKKIFSSGHTTQGEELS